MLLTQRPLAVFQENRMEFFPILWGPGYPLFSHQRKCLGRTGGHTYSAPKTLKSQGSSPGALPYYFSDVIALQ